MSGRFGMGAAAKAEPNLKASSAVPAKWDETTGLLIIGTGFAGLAAALEAHYLGMKNEEIMVVDKMPTAGGNSIINGGAVAAAGTDMQEKEGIKDSPDLLYADILKAGGGLAHPSLARRIADESVENFYWLRDKIGVKFKAVTFHGGHSVKRSHAVTNNSGSGFINPMLAKLKESDRRLASMYESQLAASVPALVADTKNSAAPVKVAVKNVGHFGAVDALRKTVLDVRAQLGEDAPVVVALAGVNEDDKPMVAVATNEAARKAGIKAGDLVRGAAKVLGGGGGGKPDFAQGGGVDASKIDEALEALKHEAQKA